jgi:hypothetical protein
MVSRLGDGFFGLAVGPVPDARADHAATGWVMVRDYRGLVAM